MTNNKEKIAFGKFNLLRNDSIINSSKIRIGFIGGDQILLLVIPIDYLQDLMTDLNLLQVFSLKIQKNLKNLRSQLV